jgi:alpha-L-arabinofuranosidase
MSDPRITIANHLPINGPFECPMTESLADGVSSPFRTAFFHVFKSLVDGAGGTYVESTVSGSPTFDSVDYQIAAGVKGAPVLLSLAVRDASSGKLYVWIVNRDLALDVSARVAVRGHALPSSLTADVIDGPAVDSMNTSDAPTTITPKTQTLAPTNDVHFTFPAHSLVRLTFVW